MAETNEPRALTSALASPAFVTRNSGMAMHAANRHVERWAPEAGADRVRSLRNLGFVDRLVAPWLETAQRSSTLRMFSTAHRSGPAEREGGAVSWVFPRPWYQDELDWMAAARQVPAQTEAQSAPTMLTTRGTFVAPRSVATTVMPHALYEYVAPSLSIAQSSQAQPQGVGFAGATRADAFSPLVSFASVQAAQMIARIAPAVAQTTRAPQLRNVLATILDRATVASEPLISRHAANAPELETPPAPRADAIAPSTVAAVDAPVVETPAMQVAQRMVEQRQQIVELQRVAQQAAVRELQARQATVASQPDTNREAARVAAVRAEQLRAEAAVAQARGEVVRGEAARVEAARSEAARGEAARIEDRIAARVSERRLHEQARVEAAQHARTPDAVAPVVAGASTPLAPTQLTAPTTAAPSAIAAALAALPPQLATYIGARPDRAVQAMAELDTAMRAVELLARGAATQQTFEATRGPRMMLPAGLGGLVATLDHSAAPMTTTSARAQLDRQPVEGRAADVAPTPVRREMRLPTLASFEAPMPQMTAAARPMLATQLRPTVADMRAPVTQFGPAAAGAQQIGAPRSAFAATMQSAPTALTHVAWADRWLARFAGAQPRSLDTFAAASTGGFQALVDAAPGAVFVAPVFDTDRAPVMTALAQQMAPIAPSTTASTAPVASMPTARASQASVPGAASFGVGTREVAPTLIASAPQVVRYDDSAETPDEVFAQISSATSRSRAAAKASARPTAPVVSELAPVAANSFATPSYADAIAHSAPVAPSAGMAAQLSASPFAPALRHVLPLTAGQTFDVRALFGAGVSTAYLAGLLSTSSHEIQAAIGHSAAPAWARSIGFMGDSPMTSIELGSVGAPTERTAAEIDYAYVAPALSDLPADATPEMIAAAQEQVAVAQAQQVQQAQQTAIAQVAAQLVASRATTPSEIAQIAQQVGVSASELSAAVARVGTSAAQAQTQAIAPTTTMRTALLSWDAPSTEAPAATVGYQQQNVSPAFAPITPGQAMMDALSMPMLGETALETSAWTGPGMVAERARAYSVAQERSSADLSFDFVAPELVLAARVYGLGPAEAAQAARLAVAGPGHLTAMAGAVDRTFVQAMAIEAERRQQAAAIQMAYPTSSGEIVAGVAPAQRDYRPADAMQNIQNAPAYAPGLLAQPTPSHPSFGVERRVPRGAFLWPSATVGALGLNAAAPDGEQSMSVAALELLAAQAVAELGTYAALAERTPDDRAPVAPGEAQTTQTTGDVDAPSEQQVAQVRAQRRREQVMQQLAAAPSIEAGTAALYQRGDASSESDVLSAAAALVPMARRARFDALYIALSQSANSKTWSPAARAARAFALAGHGSDDAQTLSVAERAATAWDVLPVVYATSVDTEMARERASAEATRTNKPLPLATSSSRRGQAQGRRGATADVEMDTIRVDSRPGLAGLSARAGEALGSYVEPTIVNPTPTASSSSSSSGGGGAINRVPTAAQELVRTGRPAGRHGGGETEIPAWFEAAARKMLDDRTPASEGISLAELTLINTMPATQIAASKDDGPSAGSAAPAASTANVDTPHKVDIEKVAQEVYQFIMQMLDHARARNGEPYL